MAGETTVLNRPQLKLSNPMTAPEFLIAASRNGRLRLQGYGILPVPLVEEVVMRGKLRGERVPDPSMSAIREKPIWVPQVFGFRLDGSKLGECVTRIDAETETRLMVPREFSQETRIRIGEREFVAAITAREWDSETHGGKGCDGRTLIVLHPIGPKLVPMRDGNVRFKIDDDMLLPSGDQRDGTVGKRVFARLPVAGAAILPITRIMVLEYLMFDAVATPSILLVE